jgi:hypothetical protein
MASYSSGRNGRRPRGGSRRRSDNRFRHQSAPSRAPAKKSFWQKITALFTGGAKPAARPMQPARSNGSEPSRTPRKPEAVEVTTPRLYVGNLSFDATESDLFELFNGVGAVQNAEVVTYKHNQRSKGFAFVEMQTVDEAKRAVAELHDKEFLGRKLVVSGAKSSEHHSAA